MIKRTNEITTEELGGGVGRKILSYADDMMAVEVQFEKGAIGSLHSHPHSQISYVLEGRFEVTLGNEKHIIGIGDTYYAKPMLLHGVICLEKGRLLDIFTPMREDFLKK